MMKCAQAIKGPGAWKLPPNEVWNVPDDVGEVRFDFDVGELGFGIRKVRGLAVDGDGNVYGIRTLHDAREDGYCMRGRVKVGGNRYWAFTSSVLFERPDGSLCNVGVLCMSREKGR